jgi:hypothetical protein
MLTILPAINTTIINAQTNDIKHAILHNIRLLCINNGLFHVPVAYQSIIRLHRMTYSITGIAFLSIPFSQVAKNHLILLSKISVR